MFNNNGESKMSNLKIDIIKKVCLLDTKNELEQVYSFVNNAICREMDLEDKEQEAFAKWKESRKKEDTDEITF